MLKIFPSKIRSNKKRNAAGPRLSYWISILEGVINKTSKKKNTVILRVFLLKILEIQREITIELSI